jgi:hypothetical protein
MNMGESSFTGGIMTLNAAMMEKLRLCLRETEIGQKVTALEIDGTIHHFAAL